MYLGTAAGPELQVLAQESNEGTGTILHDCTKFSRILISPISSELRPQNLSLTAIISSLTAIISNVDFGAAAVRAPPDSQAPGWFPARRTAARVLRYQCIKTPVPVLNAVPREVPYQVRLRAVNSAINTFRVLRAPKFWGCQLQGMGRQKIGAGVMFYHILPRPRAGIPYLPREFTSIA